MFHRYIAAAAVTTAALLAACGGGGSGSTPAPIFVTPTPSPTPKVTITYALRWTGSTHSTASSALRAARSRAHALDTTISEPIELAVGRGLGSLIDGSGATNGVLQVVAMTSSGSPAPAVDPNSIAITNTALAAASPLPTPTASPSPGAALNVASVNSDASAMTGSTVLTATMPDGSTPTTNVDVYSAFTMECPAAVHPDSVQGYTVTGGALVASNFSGDVYFTAACADTIMHFPYGYETFLESTPLSSIATALPFTSLGTSVDIESLESQATAVSNPIGGVIFATAGGDYVKLRFSQLEAAPQLEALAGAAEVCPAGICPL